MLKRLSLTKTKSMGDSLIVRVLPAEEGPDLVEVANGEAVHVGTVQVQPASQGKHMYQATIHLQREKDGSVKVAVRSLDGSGAVRPERVESGE